MFTSPAPRMSVWPIQEVTPFDFDDDRHPTRVQGWKGGDLALEGNASHYLMVRAGSLSVTHGAGSFELGRGCFGTVPGPALLNGQGQALVVSSLGYLGMPLFGGPLENDGRLRYLDNCTNSLLLAPPVRGEPCLNFLKLPGATRQTPHTHPSLRVGLVFSGHGRCQTADGFLPLEAGIVFVIPPGALHSFQSERDDLRIVIYHPDSDTGPTHEDHTMLNRTLIDGVSARGLTDLHTKA
jgi:mannose-6-phosphate isomerase-like protein (cupin superfamily)